MKKYLKIANVIKSRLVLALSAGLCTGMVGGLIIDIQEKNISNKIFSVAIKSKENPDALKMGIFSAAISFEKVKSSFAALTALQISTVGNQKIGVSVANTNLPITTLDIYKNKFLMLALNTAATSTASLAKTDVPIPSISIPEDIKIEARDLNNTDLNPFDLSTMLISRNTPIEIKAEENIDKNDHPYSMPALSSLDIIKVADLASAMKNTGKIAASAIATETAHKPDIAIIDTPKIDSYIKQTASSLEIDSPQPNIIAIEDKPTDKVLAAENIDLNTPDFTQDLIQVDLSGAITSSEVINLAELASSLIHMQPEKDHSSLETLNIQKTDPGIVAATAMESASKTENTAITVPDTQKIDTLDLNVIDLAQLDLSRTLISLNKSDNNTHHDPNRNHRPPVTSLSPSEIAKITDLSSPIYVMVHARNNTAFSSETIATVMLIPFRTGDTFRAGNVLLGFDCRVQKADLRKAKAQQESANSAYKSASKLKSYDTISEHELIKARAEAEMAAAEVDKLTAFVDKCTITAPYDGAISDIMTHVGESVKPGDPLLKIVNTVNLELEMQVPSQWLEWLIVGTPFKVSINEINKTLSAKVARINPEIDPVSQTVKIIGALTTPNSLLLPGMSGQANFADGESTNNNNPAEVKQ
jgi:RND family efflux transporter MFP subunit